MALDHFTLALRWAAGNVPEQGLKGHSMFCDRETIYSWGKHWPLATHRHGVVLVNADTYMRNGKPGKSTQRHKAMVSRALHHHAYVSGDNTFTIPQDGWDDKKLAVQFYREKLIEVIGKWQRARSNKWVHMDDARYTLSEFRTFCEFHKINFDALLKRDVKLALTCAIIALNPGG